MAAAKLVQHASMSPCNMCSHCYSPCALATSTAIHVFCHCSCVLSMQMYYKDGKSVNALGFSTTRHIYKEGLGMSCMEPCERIDPQHIGNFLTPAVPCDICEVCGINGDQITMMVCECCTEQGREVQVCCSCLPQKQLQWLLDDPECSHHWRCSSCR